jgi:hypothetical protein
MDSRCPIDPFELVRLTSERPPKAWEVLFDQFASNIGVIGCTVKEALEVSLIKRLQLKTVKERWSMIQMYTVEVFKIFNCSNSGGAIL